MSVGNAPGRTASGVGANLLANQLEKWKARAHEAEAHERVAENAPNPLLSTVMVLVHAHKGGLPDARTLLYEESVEILLCRWEQIPISSTAEL